MSINSGNVPKTNLERFIDTCYLWIMVPSSIVYTYCVFIAHSSHGLTASLSKCFFFLSFLFFGARLFRQGKTVVGLFIIFIDGLIIIEILLTQVLPIFWTVAK